MSPATASRAGWVRLSIMNDNACGRMPRGPGGVAGRRSRSYRMARLAFPGWMSHCWTNGEAVVSFGAEVGRTRGPGGKPASTCSINSIVLTRTIRLRPTHPQGVSLCPKT